jgi:hypothetical protein
MEPLFSEIEKCLDAGLYYSALINSLILPDVCASITKGDDPVGKRYKSWYEKYIGSEISGFDSTECYILRCSMVHQGTLVDDKSKYSRICFIDPSVGASVDGVVISLNDLKILILDVIIFCKNLVAGGRRWYEENKNDEFFKRNYEKLFAYHIDGFPPFIKGIPTMI